jgi:hypothetical protein
MKAERSGFRTTRTRASFQFSYNREDNLLRAAWRR